MQEERRERLIALAAQVAAETDPAKFHRLILELNDLLDEKIVPIRGTGKTSLQSPAK